MLGMLFFGLACFIGGGVMGVFTMALMIAASDRDRLEEKKE